MEEVKFLLTNARRKNGVFDKGCVVHNTKDAAEQGFHNYFTAYAYGREEGTDYVIAYIMDTNGAIVRTPEIWQVA